ncbi:MAG: DUF3313 domain-containing protein [Syntrophales bacterium]|jgi:hypothetical protein|nr:DUF3313 domain-containing protein [Syntrophales bacterium]MCK9390843.1 DUF3313 domain-containing protein [Syntrophales bacterium]
MKVLQRIMMIVALGLLLTTFAEAAQDIPFSGFFGNQTIYEQLQPGPKGGAKLRWVKQGVDANKYNKYMVDSVIFFLANNADYKGIDPQEMKELSDNFNKEIVAAFNNKYQIVAEPGPNVARIRIAITNIQPSKPGYSAITSIVPVGIGISLVKKGATGGWSGSGQTCMEIMVLDSTTNETLILLIDKQKAEFEHRFTKWGSATDAFKLWSAKMIEFIDNSKKINREAN